MGSPGGQAACTGGTGRRPPEIRDPGEGWLRGHRGTGSMHGGTAGVPWRYGVPEGPVACTGGDGCGPQWGPQGRDGNGVPGSMPRGGEGGIPRIHGVPREGRPRGAGGGGGGRGASGSMAVPGLRNVAAPALPGPRPPRVLPARGRDGGGGCGKAAGVRLGNRPPPRHAPAAAPHGPPPPWLTFKQDFFFPFLASIWAKNPGGRTSKRPAKAGL